MGYYSGVDGFLESEGVRIGRVASWSLSADVELYDKSKVGDCVKSYEPGPRTITGSASIWYYNDEPKSLLSKVLNTGDPAGPFDMRLGWGAKQVSFKAIVTSANVSCEVGAVMQAQISFQVNGALTGAAL